MVIEDESAAEGVVLGDMIPENVIRVLRQIRGSFMYFVASVGVVCIVLGAVGPLIPWFGSFVEGPMAGFLGIWGVSAILFAGLGFLFMRLIGYN